MARPSAQSFAARSRSKTRISTKLENKLAAYISVAGAGASLLTLAQPAEAKIIYTPANINISGSIPLDLNGDGIPDVYVSTFNHNFGTHQSFSYGFEAKTPSGNGVVMEKPPRVSLPADLFFGAPVGPGRTFASAGGGLDFCFGNSGHSSCGGYFLSPLPQTKYLGVQFKISGQTYYGWVRIHTSGTLITGTITGYAYEDTPNTPIDAGVLHRARGSEKAAVPSTTLPVSRQASLGFLALGSLGLSARRRDDDQGT